MTDNLKRALESREHPVGTWISVGHPAIVEVNAALGYDFVLIDTEHTSMSLETVENLARAVEASDSTTEAIVRIPEGDPTRIKRVLDIGIAGVMIPMVESAAEARRLVEAGRYPPDGIRGIAGGRAATYGLDLPEYVREANGSILTIVQIETQAGIENVEEIAAVDGVDALFVGPADLSGALDVFAQWEDDELSDAIDRVLQAGENHDTAVGTLTVDPERIAGRVDDGFDYLIVGKDTAHLASSSRNAKSRYEQAVADSEAVTTEHK